MLVADLSYDEKLLADMTEKYPEGRNGYTPEDIAYYVEDYIRYAQLKRRGENGITASGVLNAGKDPGADH